MDELLKGLVSIQTNIQNLANACIVMAQRVNQQDALIVQLQERVAMLEAAQGIDKAMLH